MPMISAPSPRTCRPVAIPTQGAWWLAYPNGDGGSALLGRIRECHVLDRLLESGRAGQSRVLVLRGAPRRGALATVFWTERGTGSPMCVPSRALRVT
jgi:hypothetical protein